MMTKEHRGNAMQNKKAKQPQQNKTNKQSAIDANIGDLEQQASSNKGKGPAGENL
jgi:hypothetical protein